MSPMGIGNFQRGKKPPEAGGGGGTFTFNPSAQAGAIDSWSSLGGSYLAARAGDGISAAPGGTLLVGTGYVFQFGDTYTPAYEDFNCRESFLDFDLSSLTGTVSSATLSLGLNADFSSLDFTVEARLRDWGGTLTAADWVPGADLAALTLLATLSTAGIGAAGSYKTMIETGTALRDAVIAAGAGTLRMVLNSDLLRSTTPPSQNEYVGFEHWNHATLKPKLVVVTT